MSDSTNQEWIKTQDAARGGSISAYEAMERTRAHYGGALSGYVEPIMTWLREAEERDTARADREEARARNQEQILIILQREEERHKEQQRLDQQRHEEEKKQREAADANLRTYFHRELSNVAEALSQRLDTQDARITGLENGQAEIKRRLDAKRERFIQDEVEITRLAAIQQAQQAEIDRIKAEIAARPSPEEARATYEGVRTWGPQIADLTEAMARIEQELKRGNAD